MLSSHRYNFEAKSRLDSEIGSGVGGPLGMGLLTPYAGLTLGDSAERFRTGLRWNASQSATVGLEATRGESDNKPTNALMLRAAIRW